MPSPSPTTGPEHAALVREHEDMVFAVCRRFLRHDPDARDATQEVFLRLCRQDLSELRFPRSWLYTCAMNVCRDLVRRDSRLRDRQTKFLTGKALNGSDPTPSAEVARDEVFAYLDDILKELEPDAQDVVLAYYYEDKSLAAIGETIGLSKMGVKKRLDKALEVLRERLVKRGVEPTP